MPGRAAPASRPHPASLIPARRTRGEDTRAARLYSSWSGEPASHARPVENAWPKRRDAALLRSSARRAAARPSGPTSRSPSRAAASAWAARPAAPTPPRTTAATSTTTDYLRSNLRLFRLNLDVEAHAGSHLALVGQLRSDNLDSPRPYALYLRVRPWTTRAFDIQAGRIPPVFGSYPRRRYALDNPLPGMPLAYQYLTSLRADALPDSTDDFHAQQGSGWLVRGYPIGDQYPAPGLPLVNAEHWDTGVEVRIGARAAAARGGGHPGNALAPAGPGRQRRQAGLGPPRLAPCGRPRARGLGRARGLPLARGHRPAVRIVPGRLSPDAAGLRRGVLGGLLDPARRSRLDRLGASSAAGSGASIALEALGVMLEARYKVAPGFYLAGRADHLGFSRVESGRPHSLGRARDPPRDRGRLLAPPAPVAQGLLSAQPAGRRPRPQRNYPGRSSSCCGSDREDASAPCRARGGRRRRAGRAFPVGRPAGRARAPWARSAGGST